MTLRSELDFEFFYFLKQSHFFAVGLGLLDFDLSLQPQIFLQKYFVLSPQQLKQVFLVLKVIVLNLGLENEVLNVTVQILNDLQEPVFFLGELQLAIKELFIFVPQLDYLVLVNLVCLQMGFLEFENLIDLLLLLHDDLLQLGNVVLVKAHNFGNEGFDFLGHIQGLESMRDEGL